MALRNKTLETLIVQMVDVLYPEPGDPMRVMAATAFELAIEDEVGMRMNEAATAGSAASASGEVENG